MKVVRQIWQLNICSFVVTWTSAQEDHGKWSKAPKQLPNRPRGENGTHALTTCLSKCKNMEMRWVMLRKTDLRKKHQDDKSKRIKLIKLNKNTIYPTYQHISERVGRCEQVVVMYLFSRGKCVNASVPTFSSEWICKHEVLICMHERVHLRSRINNKHPFHLFLWCWPSTHGQTYLTDSSLGINSGPLFHVSHFWSRSRYDLIDVYLH